MSGNDEQRGNGRVEIPIPQDEIPRFLQMPEQIGEVNIDDKSREILLGLNNRLLKVLAPMLLTKDRKPPDTTALWNEALAHLASLSRFVRDADGKFHLGGFLYDDFLKNAEPLFVNLQNWSGIFGALGQALHLAAMLIASLHDDVKHHLGKEELKSLVPEDALIMFRLEYESKNLESMKNVFATEPNQGNQRTQGFV